MAKTTVSDARASGGDLTGRLAQLQAQMVLISGEGFESFKSMNEELQANYLWGVQEGIDECKELAEQLSQIVHKQ